VQELRDRYNAFVARHETAWELTMAALAVVFVVVGFLEENPTATMVDLALTGVFVAEFGSRFVAARDRTRYLRAHWIDALALIPAVRGFRLLRLLRLLRLVRAFAGTYRAAAAFQPLARHRGLLLLFFVWLAVAALTSMWLYAAENGVNEAVTSPFDALWWGIVTLTTVGYGDVFPITPEGRIAASVLMVLGIALFSVITATMASVLMTQGPTVRDEAGDWLRRLATLREEGLLTEEEYTAKRTEAVAAL
jgi:voltage-gated potassium channel